MHHLYVHVDVFDFFVRIIVQVLFEVQALGDFPGEEDEDLGFKDREILTILESR